MMMMMMMKIPSPIETLNSVVNMKMILMIVKPCNYIYHIRIRFDEVYLFICNSEHKIDRVLNLLNLMEADLSYCSQLNLSERNMMLQIHGKKSCYNLNI